MPTAQELIVAIRSEGAQDTAEDVRDTGDAFDETAEQAENAADNAEDFSANIKGAVAAAATGLAIATASFASNIPVLEENLSGLGAVFNALSLAADTFIRSIGGEKITGGLFDIAGDINSTEGSTRNLIGAATLLGGVLGTVGGAMALVKVKALGLMTSLGLIKGTITGVATKAAGLVASLGAIPAVVAGLAVGILAFFAAYALGLGDIRKKTDRFAQSAEQSFEQFLRSIRQTLLGVKKKIAGIFPTLGPTVSNALSDAMDEVDKFGNSAEQAFENFLRNIRQTLLDVKRDIKGFIKDIASDVSNVFDGSLGDVSAGEVSTTRNQTASQAGSTAGGRVPRGVSATGNSDVRLDGRRVSQSTGRYREDTTNRRGGI
jgi:flagellar hook-basal body complex protein FliE